MVRRTVLTVVFAAGAVPLTAQPCLACTCVPPEEGQTRQEHREEQAKNADVVFTGKVRDIERGEQLTKVRFWVGRKYKGTHREKLTITTASQGSVCGYHFKDAKRYTVFGYGDGPRSYSTNLCSGTQRGRIDGEKYGFD